MGERFFNWQSDMDWAWGPLVSLRPPRNQPIFPWVWVRLFVIFTALGVLPIGLLGVAFVLLREAAARHQPLPAALSDVLTTVQDMANDPQARVWLLILFLALPPLFFAFCLPYHWAWNCRAKRLQSQEPLVENAEPGDVWPPAIKS